MHCSVLVFSERLLKMLPSCMCILPHHPRTQVILWLKLGFLSGEVWDSVLNLRSTADAQENQLSFIYLCFYFRKFILRPHLFLTLRNKLFFSFISSVQYDVLKVQTDVLLIIYKYKLSGYIAHLQKRLWTRHASVADFFFFLIVNLRSINPFLFVLGKRPTF